MLRRLAVGVVLLSLSGPAVAQRRPFQGADAFSSGDDLSEPADEDAAPNSDEDVPADLMTDDADDGAPAEGAPAPSAPASFAAAASAPAGAAGGAEFAPAARPRVEEEKPSPATREAAIDRVADDCHSERGLFCDAVKTEDVKVARCLLKYRDDVLEDCRRALDAARPFLK